MKGCACATPHKERAPWRAESPTLARRWRDARAPAGGSRPLRLPTAYHSCVKISKLPVTARSRRKRSGDIRGYHGYAASPFRRCSVVAALGVHRGALGGGVDFDATLQWRTGGQRVVDGPLPLEIPVEEIDPRRLLIRPEVECIADAC